MTSVLLTHVGTHWKWGQMWGLDESIEGPDYHKGELGLCSSGDGGGFLNGFCLQHRKGARRIVGCGFRGAVWVSGWRVSGCALAGAGAQSRQRLGVRKAGTARRAYCGKLRQRWGAWGKTLQSRDTWEETNRIAISFLGVKSCIKWHWSLLFDWKRRHHMFLSLLTSGIGLRKCHYFCCEIDSRQCLCIADYFHLGYIHHFGAWENVGGVMGSPG